jgi:two-component system cell cycle response regulator DivK
VDPASVLLVEDHQDTVEGYESYLSWFGFATETAKTGAEALARLRERATDVVVMDMGLPGVSGWDTVRALRRQSSIAAIPVIAFTGHASEADRVLAAEVGCDAFVPKPALPIDLVAEINRILTRAWARATLEESRDLQAQRALLTARANELIEVARRNVAEMASRRQELGQTLARLKSLR